MSLQFPDVHLPNPLDNGPSRARREQLRAALLLAFAALVLVLALVFWQGPATASTEDKLNDTQARIAEQNDKKGVLTDEIASLSAQIDDYESQVAALRAEERDAEIRLAAKQAELDQAQAQVDRAYRELKILAARLKRSLGVLKDRIVAIYKAGDSDMSDLILTSKSYGDLIETSSYIEQIQNRNESIVTRVRDLRDQQEAVVVRLKKAKDTIEAARNEIAAEEKNLATARQAVQSQAAELASVRAARQAKVDTINSKVEHLEDIEADLQQKIAEQIAAASGVSVLPAGPMTSPSAAGLIWPLSGTVTSGFGPRSSPGGIGSTYHEGIDISVPEGTPIRAAASGTVIMASYNGGYGNYTCVDHGSGLSTCYAHQSGFAVSAGQSVDQGQIIGYSGNTGSSTGPHLHFEVRINGAAQDPMGYL
ncbi:MAG: peptidoglycan DD-metalloendopeptidase family protein [Solirubrobacterales bacterium]|jgi:murein DD-endopeptidase MepM/ murein hydrolase activator NlpD|nr:peptidoglycan DD-metalloendopeptidase family protein [Solirubrobacterales bacterium]